MTFHAKRHCRIAHAVDDARYHFRLTAALSLMPQRSSARRRSNRVGALLPLAAKQQSALTRETTPGAAIRAGGNLRRSQSAREHGVDARLELYAADGRLFHLFWPVLLLAAEAFAPGGAAHPRRPVEDSRLGPQRRMIGRLPADDPVELS
jgi:hypothetical protein